MTERLQKRIASSGYCSRRAAEKLIEAGEVKVNGKIVREQGVQVSENDKIVVEGVMLRFDEKKITLAFNKPVGVVTTRNDPFGAKTVMDLLPSEFQYLNPVGRLDLDSEGLLLFSSDGDLILHLTHPRYEHQKTYEVGVRGHVSNDTIKALARGVELDGIYLQPMEARVLREKGKETWIELTLKEGRKRQIRRVMERFGHTVFALKRTAIGKLQLGDLKTGAYRILTPKEIQLALFIGKEVGQLQLGCNMLGVYSSIMKKIFGILVLSSLLMGLVGCAQINGEQGSEKLQVAASIYPLAFFAEQIGGDLIEVTTLVPQGFEPHDFEPSPNDLKTLYNADLVVYNGAALEPWLEDVEPDLTENGVKLFKATDSVELISLGEEDGGWDPHVWLDPIRAEMIVQSLASTLATLDSENAEVYQNNANVIAGELDKLDENFSMALGLLSCSAREFVTAHAAFAYLADRYGLTMIPISGVNPHDEPSIKDLEEISKIVKEHGLTTIYMETLMSPAYAETISEETGASLLVLNPLEGLTTEDIAAGENYFTIMRRNFGNLKVGFVCDEATLL
ncbi:MAG: pseudouridine synthase [Candidatus Gracilibacteria bacterium]